MLRFALGALFLGFGLQAFAADPHPTAWDQWRGPTRDGRLAADAVPLPPRLDEAHLKQVWRVELAEGYSTPVVRDGRIYTVETQENKREVVRAFGLDGREVWNTDWTGALQVPFFARRNGSWVRSSPALAGDTLLVGGMRDVLVAIDPTAGKELWRLDFMETYRTPLPDFGFASSPLVDGDAVYVQAGASVARVERKTGKVVWRALEDGGGMWNSAFSSPMIATLCGVRQLVVQTRTRLAGVELDSGKVLWSVDVKAFRGMNILNPTVVGDQVFTSSYGGGSFLFTVRRDGEAWSVEQAWQTKAQGYMSTPVVLDGHIYLHRRDKRFSCVELATGTEKWASGERFSDYASLVTDGRRILALDSRGELLLLNATPERFEIIDRRKVSEQETWAHVVVYGRMLLVRELRGLSLWRLEAGQAE